MNNQKINFQLAAATEFKAKEIRDLYESVGWFSYTEDLENLLTGLKVSSRVVTAHYEGTLVGLARVISDGYTIAYLQDVLVKPNYQGLGIGRALVTEALKPFSQVRQKVLLTDDEVKQRIFYESLGFTEISDFKKGQLRAFVQIK